MEAGLENPHRAKVAIACDLTEQDERIKFRRKQMSKRTFNLLHKVKKRNCAAL